MQPMRSIAVIFSMCGACTASAQVLLTTKDLATLVEKTFGPVVRLASDGKDSSFPRYLRASLNYDDVEDLVVPLYVDKAKGTLDTRGIKPVPPRGERSVDASIGEHCLGLAFLHGSGEGQPFKPASAYLAYECFSGYTKVRAGAQLLTNAGVPVHNDAVLLDLENGGQMLIYWRSGEYAERNVRRGD
jgi:hypothetical protein